MATEKMEVYKCEACLITAQILGGGAGDLMCCGQPMTLLEEKTADAPTEKHVPVVEETDEGVRVKVGSTPHPMEDSHFIAWVEICGKGKTSRQFLKPGDAPEASFNVAAGDIEKAREYCTVHGLWKS